MATARFASFSPGAVLYSWFSNVLLFIPTTDLEVDKAEVDCDIDCLPHTGGNNPPKSPFIQILFGS